MPGKDFIHSGKKIRFRTNSSFNDKTDTFQKDYFSNIIKNEDEHVKTEHDFHFESHDEPSKPSLSQFLRVELTRGYLLEHDEERYSARREKVYSFMKIPREVEKFMAYGFFQCADAFLFIYTFLPLRLILALWAVVSRPVQECFGVYRRRSHCVLKPAEICDLLKACIMLVCSVMMLYIDTSMMYHLIKSQSVIKLYIFFNMLEVCDRLFSAFGQDTIDALFWTATEPRDRGREHLGVIPHLLLSVIYVFLHGLLVLFQATTLNVAINSNNKALLTIMISNQFVELKGSVFKKFDKNNLFQVSCSDVRERFHLFLLLFIVILQTMKEYSWKEERFWILLPDCLLVLVSEVFVDWIKHAFISRFNELPADVYKDYTISLAYDVAQTRQKHAFADHSDLVARRMGFIPLPLGVVMFRVLVQTISLNNLPAVVLLILSFMCLTTFRILISLVVLGKASDLISQHKMCNPVNVMKSRKQPEDSLKRTRARQDKATSAQNWNSPTMTTGSKSVQRELFRQRDMATSPTYPGDTITVQCKPEPEDRPACQVLNRSQTIDLSTSTSPLPRKKKNSKQMDSNLGPALFSNSTVDINNVCLNEELLKEEPLAEVTLEGLSRSTPDIKKQSIEEVEVIDLETPEKLTKKRAESVPSLPLLLDTDVSLET